MPKPKKDKEKKTSGAGGWDWSSFATEPSTPAKTTSQPQQPQNKGADWDWSTLPTNQADETRRQQREQEQRQAGQQAAARYAAQDRVISAGRYAADAMRGGLRTLGMGRDYTADDLEIQSDRYRRDYQRYTEMARDARQYRDAGLLSMAQNGLRQSGDAYNDSYQRYLEAQQQAKDKRNQELKKTNKAQWYGENLSREQIEGQLRLLELERKNMQGMTDEAYRAYADGSSRGSDLQYEGYSKRLQDIDDEIATYKAALGQRQAIEYQDTRQAIAPHGYLPEAMWGQRDEGRRKYEADRAASVHAVGDMAGDELSSGRTGYADYRRAMTESGYNYEFEEAKHLKQVDADIFYVLYNEDPEKAREWLHQAKLSREEQYASQLSEWAGRDAGTTAMAFVGGTAARIESGLLNLLTGTTEDALNASRTGKALLAGGAERLNRVYGTVDERIPFIGNLLGGKGLGDLYQLASSVVESRLTAGIAAGAGELSDAVQALGVIIMGSSAAADDYDECLKRGLNEDQARRHAFAAGLNEAAFEWISLDKLVNPNFSASQIRQWLVQSGVEASEEFCTTIANRLTDGLLARRDGYDTQIEQRMKELIALGVDHDEAKERAEHEWTTELINDALGGFLSGGAGQLLNSVTGYAMSKYGDVADRMRFENDQSRRLERSGAAITSQEELQSMQSYAKANGINFDQAAEAKLASTGTTDSSTPAEASAQNDSGRQGVVPTEQEPSRKEKRQQAKSNRSTGVLQEQVVRSISDSIQKRGLDQAQTVYDETVSQHGQGIARQAAEAVRRSASEQLGKLNNSAELEQAYKAASAGATEPAVRKAIEQAYNAQAYAIAQRTGNEEAAERIQQRVLNTSGSGNRNLSLEVQVTNKDGSTSTAEITGVTANAEQVKLSNGQTVSVDQLAGIDADTKDVLDRIKYMEVGPAANLMWKAYQLEKKSGTVTDGYRWIMEYTMAFDQGRQGSISLEQAIGRAEGLSPQIAEMAYQQGRDLAQEMTDQQKADLKKRTSITRKGATGRAGTVNTDAISGMRLSEAQKKQLDIVKRIAEVFGIDVEVFASGTKNVTVNGKRMRAFQGENGSYENGRIRLDINAGLNYIGDIGSGLVATMGHELTHFIQQFAPQEYKAYKEFVLSTIAKTRGSQTLERLIQEKIDRSKSKLSRTAAEDEVVADAAQTVLTDSQAIRQMAEQEPTLFEKVLQWIKDFFDEIRDALADSPRMSEEARLFRGLEAEVKKAFGELWDKGITEAVRVHDVVGDIEGSQEQNSERATDDAYMKAVEDGDMETAQRMVDEAAKKAGYKYKAYHGTASNFTIFDKEKIGSTYEADEEGFFFTSDKNEADWAAGDAHQKTGDDERILSVYLRIKHPLIVNTKESSGTDYFDAWKYSLLDRMHGYDKDGIVIKGTKSTTYVVLDSEQVKSAEPVTYDDSGNLIPLSERFNQESEDIRYSERDYSLPSDQELMDNAAESLSEAGGEEYWNALLESAPELANDREELRELMKANRAAARKLAETETKLEQSQDALTEARKQRDAWKTKANNRVLQRTYNSKVLALEKQVEREKKILAGTLTPPAMQRLLKAAREDARKKAETHKDEVFANYRERKNITALKSRIQNLTADIRKTAASPTERSFLPAHLAGAMVDLLDVLEQGQVDTPKAGTKAASKYYSATDAIRALADAYKQIESDPDYTYSSEFEQDVYDGIVKLSNQFVRQTKDGHKYNITANEMSLQELQQVYDTVREIREGFRNAAKLIGMDSSLSTYDYAGKILGHQREIREAKAGKKGKKLRSLYDNIQIDALSPIRAAHMMDGFQDAEFYQLWKQVEAGLGQKNRVIMDSTKRLQSFKTGQNELTYLKALREKSDYGIKDVNGKPVLMTKMQAIQMLMTWQREEANQNLVHMQEGGVIIRDADLISRGRYSDAKKTQQKVKVTPEMIQQIASTMTEWDKGYMKAARDVFSSLLEQSNKVLYTLKRKVHKGEAMYIPEKVAEGYLAQEVVKGGEFNLGVKEASATKDLKQKSTLPIIIDGLETMMNRHINDMANYIGLAVPIRNFAKVYNTRTSGIGVDATTVNDEITNTWGDKAGEMMMETLRQVQNGRSYEYQTVLSGLEQKIQSAFVKASLVGKISVFIKQAASYAAAGSVLSQKALDRSQQYIFAIVSAPNGKLARSVYNRIDALTPEHFMRRMGMSMEEIAMDKLSNGPIKGKLQMAGAWLEGKGKVGKAVRRSGAMLNPTNWIQRMDVATTGALVIACERQAKYDGFKRGTPEFDAHVKELYERVIRETQPMYDPLHRPALQKNAGPMARLLFPFRTVPFQNYGQIMDAFGSFQAASKENKKAAAVHFGKTLLANFESALVFAALGMLSYALMHKPKRYLDDDDELTLESVLTTYGSDVLDVTLGNLLPYGGTELKDFVERWINGDKWYQLMSVGPADLVNETASSILKLKEASDRFSAGELSANGMKNQILNTTMQVTKLLGLPVSNVRDIFNGVSAGVDDWKNGQLLWLNDDTVERSNATNARRLIKAAEAGNAGKVDEVLAEMRKNILADKPGMKKDKVNSKIQASVGAYLKEQYLAGALSKKKASDYLVRYGNADDENEAYWKIREWEAKAAHADDDEYSFNKYEDLRAILAENGDISPEVKRLTDHGVKADSVDKDVKATIKDLFTDGTITEDEAMAMLQKYGKVKDAETKAYRAITKDEAWMKVKEWRESANYTEENGSWGQYDAIDEALAGNKDIKSLVQELTTHGVEEKNITSHVKSYLVSKYEDKELNETQFRNMLSRYCGIVVKKDVDEIVNNANCYRDSGYHYDELREAYNSGMLEKAKTQSMMQKYGGMTAAEAKQRTRYWDFQVKYPDAEMSQAKVDAYYDTRPANFNQTMQEAGISMTDYIRYATQAAKATGTDADGDGKTDSGSKKAAIMQIINSLPLRANQKDALYYLNGWSAKTIWEAPWH